MTQGPVFVVHPPSSGRIADLPKRGTYMALCGAWVKLPPRVRGRVDSDGDHYLVAGPHPAYYGYCPDCAAKSPKPLYPVAS